MYSNSATAVTHIEVLRTLVTSPNCPIPALQIAGFSILRILSTPFVQEMANAIKCTLDDIGAKVRESLGMFTGMFHSQSGGLDKLLIGLFSAQR